MIKFDPVGRQRYTAQNALKNSNQPNNWNAPWVFLPSPAKPYPLTIITNVIQTSESRVVANPILAFQLLTLPVERLEGLPVL